MTNSEKVSHRYAINEVYFQKGRKKRCTQILHFDSIHLYVTFVSTETIQNTIIEIVYNKPNQTKP